MRLINFTIGLTNYIKQHSLQGVMFNISLVLISILRSTINDILSKFHSLTKVLSLLIYIVSIPNYFNNSETPIICYKYNKPIRSTKFNFNKIVNNLDIDSNTPAS